ncbi:MAG: type 4a pilus biogenesis protein PilO [Candidatus Aceula meridiana]|nr:type 4a pilus biogenesis protein PilO [Candidatus Aceula meridiana]
MAQFNPSQREKWIFISCILMICIYIGYRFVFIAMQEEETFWKAKVLTAQRKARKDLSVLREEFSVNARYGEYLKRLKQKTPDTQEMASILSEIESIAGNINLKIEDMKPKKIKKQDFYNHFSVNIRIKGDMGTITKFLYALQAKPHFFHINEMRLEKRSARTQEIKCEIVASRLLIQQ